MNIRRCTEADAAPLAEMNKRLIEDEGAETYTDSGFLKGGYSAYIFEVGVKTAGYALADAGKSPVYLLKFTSSGKCAARATAARRFCCRRTPLARKKRHRRLCLERARRGVLAGDGLRA